ncbi:MAG: FlgD immunoglobulin-like domain containing protein [bacterium]|jgi:hypothetical protein
MDSIYALYEGQVVPLRIHTWWPSGSDCFWLFNSTELEDRILYYYGIEPWPSSLYVPSHRFEGKYIHDRFDGSFSSDQEWYDWVGSTLDSLLAIPSPLRIANFDQYPMLDSVYVSFDVVADDSVYVTGGLRINLVVAEWKHRCPYPVGAHEHVVRDYLFGYLGTPISMQVGDSLHFDWAYYIDPEYRNDRLVTNIYVEDVSHNGILQARREVIPEELSGVDVGDQIIPASIEPAVPNPFTTETRIAFNMSRQGHVRLSVYTPEGRLVTDVVDETMGPGSHSAVWNGRDGSGNEMGSGIYYYRLVTGETTLTGKMILLR